MKPTAPHHTFVMKLVMASLLLALLVFSLSALQSSALAGSSSGTAAAWGDNGSGQCNIPSPNSAFISVAAGFYHSLGLKSDGTVVAWGDNSEGQCNVPSSNSGFISVAGGGHHSLGLKSDGTVVAWGNNNNGQCNIPSPNSGFIAVAAGVSNSLGLKSDGTVVAWGDNGDGQCNVPSPNNGFIAVAAGDYHSLGLKSDGTVVGWGKNNRGQCNVPSPNSGFKSIKAGEEFSLCLKSDGTVVAWGKNDMGQCNVPSPNSGFTKVAAGGAHSLGLKSDGTVVGWGDNGSGQITPSSPNSNYVDISAGRIHSLAIHSQDFARAWGQNYNGQCNVLSPNSGFVKVSGGDYFSLGLKSDGSVVGWGANESGQCNPSSPNSGFVAVSAGGSHGLGLKADGSIAAWGYNAYHQCDVPSPNSDFVAVSAGGLFSLGLKSNGTIVAWGNDGYHECDIPSPDTGFASVSAGGWHSLGLKSDGSVVAWGRNTQHQCDVPAPNSSFSAISAGDLFSLGLKSDGSVIGWGDNLSGGCTPPSPNSGFTAVSAGWMHSLGLKSDGSVAAWGNNSWGQCNVPSPDSGYASISAGGYHSLAIRAGTTPTVTTVAVSSVGTTTADSGGNVTSDGGDPVSARGVCWSTSPNPTTADDHTTDGSGTGVFTSHLTGLSPATLYYVRAYATNGAGTSYGDQESFTTITTPTVTTIAVSSVGTTTADSGGNVTSDGGDPVSARGVCWSTSPNPTTADDDTTDGSGTGVFTSHLTGLSPATPYYVRAYATNGAGTSYGDQKSFTTPWPKPVVESLDPSSGPPGIEVTINGMDFGASQGSSTVTIGGVNAAIVSWSDGRIIITVPDGTHGGAVVVTTNAGGSNTDLTFTVAMPTWYLAEGSTAWGFNTYITIMNPNPDSVTARITYMNPSAPVTAKGIAVTRDLTLPAQSQTFVDPRSDLGDVDFSTKVECLEGKSIAVERTMSWTGPGYSQSQSGYHSSIGANMPVKTWYLPEGSSAWGFETWTLVENPNPTQANVTLTYMTEAEGTKVLQKTVSAYSRATFNMEADIGAADSSIEVSSDLPVVAERSMYHHNRREGSCSIGATSPANDYFLAEGATGYDVGFITWVLVQNPQATPTDVSLTYQTQSGPVTGPSFTMPANSRKTIKANDQLPPDTNVSTQVHGSQPIVAERAMYWDNGTGEAFHAHVGLPSPHMRFMFPDGQTSNGWETWTLIQNPNPGAVRVRITYLTSTGNQSFEDEIAPDSRATYNMADKVPSGKACITVESLDGARPVLVERAMYVNNRGAGTDTVGSCSD